MPAESVAIPPGLERILVDETAVRSRIRDLGKQISRDYAGKDPVLIGILKGSFMFLADLIRSISINCSIDFMGVSSYTGVNSTGIVRVNLDLGESPNGKDLILVEDIVDTGLTLDYLINNLKTRNPKSLEVCVLLDKSQCRKAPVKAKYVGFSIPSEFVVGFGLDFNGRYRNLPYVAVLKKSLVQ